MAVNCDSANGAVRRFFSFFKIEIIQRILVTANKIVIYLTVIFLVIFFRLKKFCTHHFLNYNFDDVWRYFRELLIGRCVAYFVDKWIFYVILTCIYCFRDSSSHALFYFFSILKSQLKQSHAIRFLATARYEFS